MSSWGAGHVQAAGFAKGEGVLVNTDALNLRIGAGLSETVIDVLPSGTALIVSNGPMATDSYNWYEVETVDGRLGWVAGAFLVLASAPSIFPIRTPVRVDTVLLNVRMEPSLSARVVDRIGFGTVGEVSRAPIDADGYTWYRLRIANAADGWVAGEHLALAGEYLFPWPVGAMVRVDTDVLNVRAAPGLNGRIVDTIGFGVVGEVSRVSAEADGYVWYRLRLANAADGWVAGKFLVGASGGSFAVGDAVRVTDGPLNLRTAPGLSAQVLRVMADNEVLLVRSGPVEADGYTWYRVRNYAGEGWAVDKFLRFDPNGFPSEEGH
jgi:uncharacterized protein YgiM (DUF1202 family)